jgi:hypothetical protein
MLIKKILLALLLLPMLAVGQYDVVRHNKHYVGSGVPTTNSLVVFPALAVNDIYLDRQTQKSYVYKGVTLKWVEDAGVFPLTKEPPPVPPPAGAFPFIVVVGTGNDDAAINAAFTQQRADSRKIILVGNIVTGEVVLPKEQYDLNMEGYGAYWTFRSTATTGIRRTIPVSVAESMEYVRARIIIKGVKFFGSANQIALDLGASENNLYQDLKFSYFKTAIHLRFALRTTLFNCEAVTCTNGFIVDIGNWAGASYLSANAQSNQVHILDCRTVYSVPGGSGNVAIGVYGCSGVVIDNWIVEGAKYKRSLDFDFKMCGNVKDIRVTNVHNEPVYGNAGAGTGEAYIYLRLVGTALIDGFYSQYGGCFIDAGGTPGEVTVDIKHVGWLVKDVNAKLFNNAGGTKWVFDANSYQSYLTEPSKMAAYFTGTPVSYCASTTGCAANTYQVRGY